MIYFLFWDNCLLKIEYKNFKVPCIILETCISSIGIFLYTLVFSQTRLVFSFRLNTWTYFRWLLRLSSYKNFSFFILITTFSILSEESPSTPFDAPISKISEAEVLSYLLTFRYFLLSSLVVTTLDLSCLNKIFEIFW